MFVVDLNQRSAPGHMLISSLSAIMRPCNVVDLENGPSIGSIIYLTLLRIRAEKRSSKMNNIFYIIGVIVVVLFVLGYFGLR